MHEHPSLGGVLVGLGVVTCPTYFLKLPPVWTAFANALLYGLVATTKSEGDKREGEFSLKKPTAGFPAGQHRVEIWQAGKMIYSEKFEIKSG